MRSGPSIAGPRRDFAFRLGTRVSPHARRRLGLVELHPAAGNPLHDENAPHQDRNRGRSDASSRPARQRPPAVHGVVTGAGANPAGVLGNPTGRPARAIARPVAPAGALLAPAPGTTSPRTSPPLRPRWVAHPRPWPTSCSGPPQTSPVAVKPAPKPNHGSRRCHLSHYCNHGFPSLRFCAVAGFCIHRLVPRPTGAARPDKPPLGLKPLPPQPPQSFFTVPVISQRAWYETKTPAPVEILDFSGRKTFGSRGCEDVRHKAVKVSDLSRRSRTVLPS
jgi:hypothetical protein